MRPMRTRAPRRGRGVVGAGTVHLSDLVSVSRTLLIRTKIAQCISLCVDSSVCVGGLSCGVSVLVFECCLCLCRLRVYLAHFVVCYCLLLLLLALLIAANDRNIEYIDLLCTHAHTHT